MLRHSTLKPGYSCIKDIRTYFLSLPDPVGEEELVVIGDRVFTDVVLANRMASRRNTNIFAAHGPHDNVQPMEEKEEDVKRPHPCGPLAILTTHTWQRENVLGRALEKAIVGCVERWIVGPQNLNQHREFMRQFVRPSPQLLHDNSNRSLTAWWSRIQ